MATKTKKGPAPNVDQIKFVLDTLVQAGSLTQDQANEQLEKLLKNAEALNSNAFDISNKEIGELKGIKSFANSSSKPAKTKAEKEEDYTESTKKYIDRQDVALTGKAALEKYGLSTKGIGPGEKVIVRVMPNDKDIKEGKLNITIKTAKRNKSGEYEKAKTFASVSVPLTEAYSAIKGIANGFKKVDKDGKVLNVVSKKVNTDSLKKKYQSDVMNIIKNNAPISNRIAQFQLEETEEEKIQRAKEDAAWEAVAEEKKREKEAIGEGGLKDVIATAMKHFDATRGLPSRQRTDLSDIEDEIDKATEQYIYNYVDMNNRLPNFDSQVLPYIIRVLLKNNSDNTNVNDVQSAAKTKKVVDMSNGNKEEYIADNIIDEEVAKANAANEARRAKEAEKFALIDRDRSAFTHNTIARNQKFFNHINTLISRIDKGSTEAKKKLNSIANDNSIPLDLRNWVDSLLTHSDIDYSGTAGYASHIKNAELLDDVLNEISNRRVATKLTLNKLREDSKNFGDHDGEYAKQIKRLENQLLKFDHDAAYAKNYINAPAQIINNHIGRLRKGISDDNIALKGIAEDSPEYSRIKFNRDIKQAQINSLLNRIVKLEDGTETIKDTDALSNMTNRDVDNHIAVIKDSLKRMDENKTPGAWHELKSKLDYFKGAKTLHKYLPAQYKRIFDPGMANVSSVTAFDDVDDKGNVKKKVLVELNGADNLKKKYGVNRPSTRNTYATDDEFFEAALKKHMLKNVRAANEIERLTQEEEAARSPEEQARLTDNVSKANARIRAAENKQGAKDMLKNTGINVEGDTKLKRSAELYLNGGKANSKLVNGREYLAKSISNALSSDYPGVDIVKHVLSKLSLNDYAKGVLDGSNQSLKDKIRIDLGESKNKQNNITNAVAQSFEYLPEDPNNTQADKDARSGYYQYGDDE